MLFSGVVGCLLLGELHRLVYVEWHLVLRTGCDCGGVWHVTCQLFLRRGFGGWAVDFSGSIFLLTHHVITREAHNFCQQVEQRHLESNDPKSLEYDNKQIGLFLWELHKPLCVILHPCGFAPVLDLFVPWHAGAPLGAAHEVRAALVVMCTALTKEHQWNAAVIFPAVVVAPYTKAA